MNRKVFAIFAAAVMLIASAGGAWASPYDPSAWTTQDWEWYYYPYKYRMDDVYVGTASGIGGQWIIATKPISLDVPDDSQPYEDSRYKNASAIRTRGNAFYNVRNLATIFNPLEFQGNFVNRRDHIYTLDNSPHARATVTVSPPYDDPSINGDPLFGDKKIPGAPGIIPQQNVRYIFMVVPETTDKFEMNFGTMGYSAVYDDEYTADIRFGEQFYVPTKLPTVAISNDPAAGDYYNKYSFTLDKIDKTKYDTQRTYANFMLNPREAPAQSINVPVIISNVANGSASVNPLDIRITIRENSTNGANDGDLVAFENFKWNVESDLVYAGESSKANDWIFVPVGNKNQIGNSNGVGNYTLTADIRNFSGLRYALQRYDFTSDPTVGNAPEDREDRTGENDMTKSKLYYFDLPADVHDIESSTTRNDGLVTIPLDPLSHIAPGLITRYEMNYSSLPVNRRILYLYPPDGDRWSNDPKSLTIQHTNRMIYGATVGSASGNGSLGSSERKYSVQGFFLGTLNDKFLADNKSKLDWYGEVNKFEMVDPALDGTLISDSTVKEAYVKAGTVRTIEVDVKIPSRLQYNETTKTVGLLPLLITFNLPRNANQHVSSSWEELLDLWKTDQSGAAFKSKFRDIFELHAYTPDNRDLNISEFLLKNDAFDKNVKVIMDEEKNCITVSFFAILVDSKESWMGLLKDTLMDYIVIRDGDYYAPPLSNDQSGSMPGDPDPDLTKAQQVNTAESGKIFASAQQNRWTMKFYVDTKVETGSPSSPSNVNGGGSSGGGCAAGAAASAAIAVLALVCTRRKGDKK